MTDFIHPQESMLVLQKLMLYTYGRKKRLMRPNLPSLYGTPSRKSKQADPLSYDWKPEVLVSAHAEDRNKAGNTA